MKREEERKKEEEGRESHSSPYIIHQLAELQSDDFHLDRPLFFSCREDREKFCGKVRSGEGRVYKCLIKHKTDRGMSKELYLHLCPDHCLCLSALWYKLYLKI
ncbi:Golgi apparatus protein 1 [Portunus trituberculatus]|uniref:Golgi apparatus protein 1 n=1 Tax=Portunus trituberculatus TaxID=210409 RepID=A0A5B7IE18_PORTR|nr:Golgi apparatus protein 1 [Portunus trituberculatus]